MKMTTFGEEGSFFLFIKASLMCKIVNVDYLIQRCILLAHIRYFGLFLFSCSKLSL